MPESTHRLSVTRVQTGVRIEARLLNVLKALAALKNMSLGDLIEGIVLHAFDGEAPFSEVTLGQIRDLKKVYGLDLAARDSHQLMETESTARRAATQSAKGGRASASRRSRK